ncbi:MAG: protein phosphatase 2C domain-containing protein [Pseudomonadota bacterium]
MTKFQFACASATHPGKVRRRNEDNLLCDSARGLWVVADGMGGEAAGDYASATVISALSRVGNPHSADDLLHRTQNRLHQAHAHLVDYAARTKARVVGATVVVLLAYEGYVACVWSGDSRLYRMREGRLAQLSRDHNEVGELLARGAISRAEATTWAGRNAVTRAVGVYDELEMEVLYGDLRVGDTFVLCSDGLPLHVADEEIRNALRTSPIEAAVKTLIDLALARGGQDNVTVVIVRTEPDPARSTVLQDARRSS